MYFALFLALLMLCRNSSAQPTGQLLEDRMTNAQIFVERSLSVEGMELAFSSSVASPNIYHVVRMVGDFGPGDIAHEYDNIVLTLSQFLGYNIIVLKPTFDSHTTKWIDNNTLRVDYVLNVSTGFNTTTWEYEANVDGFRYTDYIVFDEGTALINLDYSIDDPAALKLYGDSIPADPFTVCSIYVIPACNGSDYTGPLPFLSDTGYSGMSDCVQFLSSLDQNEDECPFSRRSNTSLCRLLHAISAFFRPDIHCQHAGKMSTPCRNTCLPGCAGCGANAECVAKFPTLYTPVYGCQCKKGYKGDGKICVPATCVNGISNYARYGTYTCQNNLTMCTDSFTWDSIPGDYSHGVKGKDPGSCYCESPSSVYYDGSTPYCIPQGRCLKQYQCKNQDYNTVKCKAYGFNPITPWLNCLCNYGYVGGWEYPCTCESPRRVVWSDKLDGNVCLLPTECTADYHCTYPQRCDSSNSTVGVCA
jgi:hypothetical protein